ncbi:uncharacterized protein LOC114912034 [Scleropages formosus]|uniref:uncharacterized protein LOC114912034 n=1 Tax=Scleropages formosus TaxID=113540 RepID=UPI0010FACE25|nr:uncharacterized protein LOC114912034 [Scleropages formosus]
MEPRMKRRNLEFHRASEEPSATHSKLFVSKDLPALTCCVSMSSGAIANVSEIKQTHLSAVPPSSAPPAPETESSMSGFPQEDRPEVLMNFEGEEHLVENQEMTSGPSSLEPTVISEEHFHKCTPTHVQLKMQDQPTSMKSSFFTKSAEGCGPVSVQETDIIECKILGDKNSEIIVQEMKGTRPSEETLCEEDLFISTSDVRKVWHPPQVWRPQGLLPGQLSGHPENPITKGVEGPSEENSSPSVSCALQKTLKEAVKSLSSSDMNASFPLPTTREHVVKPKQNLDESLGIERGGTGPSFTNPHECFTDDEKIKIDVKGGPRPLKRCSAEHTEAAQDAGEHGRDISEGHHSDEVSLHEINACACVRAAVLLSEMSKLVIQKSSIDESAAPLADSLTLEGPQKRLTSKAGSTSVKETLSKAAAAGIKQEDGAFSEINNPCSPPAETGSPMSPESEMSTEVDSTLCDENTKHEFRSSFFPADVPPLQALSDPFESPSEASSGFMASSENPSFPVDGKHSPAPTGAVFSCSNFLRYCEEEDTSSVPPSPKEVSSTTEAVPTVSRGSQGGNVEGVPPAVLQPLAHSRLAETEMLVLVVERGTNYMSGAAEDDNVCEVAGGSRRAKSPTVLLVVKPQEGRAEPTHQCVLELHLEEDGSSRPPSPQEILVEVEMRANKVEQHEGHMEITAVPQNTVGNMSVDLSLGFLPGPHAENLFDFVQQETDDVTVAFELTEIPPRFIDPVCDTEAPDCGNAESECSLVGRPAPAATWFNDGLRVPHNGQKYLCESDADKHLVQSLSASPCGSDACSCEAVDEATETLCSSSLHVVRSQAAPGTEGGNIAHPGGAEAASHMFHFDVGGSSAHGDDASEIELELEFGSGAEEPQEGVRVVAKSEDHATSQRESLHLNIFSRATEGEKVRLDAKDSDACSFRFSVGESSSL